jgi:8-oxo-dGTP diphosphatase
MFKVEMLDSNQVANDLLKYAVIVTRYKDEWIFVRHEDRFTWEIPGGRREVNEDILLTAERELMEETGASKFELKAICAYSVTLDVEKSYGMLYYSKVSEFGNELTNEICERKAFRNMPKDLTYPQIQPILFKFVLNHIEACI